MITAIKKRIAQRSRSKRAALFTARIQPTEEDKILDLGGGKGRHFAAVFPFRKMVWIACHSNENLEFARQTYGFNTVQLDGTDERLPFEDCELDIIFCSSVIEHVTGPKSDAIAQFKRDGAAFTASAWTYQQRFASEIRRVAKKYYVQTPNRFFPVEVHSWIPGLGYLATDKQWKIMQVFNGFWPRKDESPDWSLLDERQMAELFPDAEIHVERFMGLKKSIIAIRA